MLNFIYIVKWCILLLLTHAHRLVCFSFMVQKLTGGTLLLRNKYYIVIYRGKDFVPTSVAAVIAERQEMTKHVQDVEEKVRCKVHDIAPSREDEPKSQAGSLAEFYEAQACWGRDISTEERERMRQEVAKAKNAKLAKKIECKLAVVSIYTGFVKVIYAWESNCVILIVPCLLESNWSSLLHTFTVKRLVGIFCRLPLGCCWVIISGTIEMSYFCWISFRCKILTSWS